MPFTNFNDQEEGRGIALAGMHLTFALVTQLAAKGILSTEDVHSLFESALSALEEAPDATAPGFQAARVIFDGMMQVAFQDR